MDESKINDIINSQKDFLDSNSNSINSRILLLKKLLINIKLFEEEIYEALSKDLNKAKFESFLTEILLVEKEIKLFIKKINKWSKDKKVKASILNFPSRNYLKPEPYGRVLIITPWNYPFQLSLTPLIGAFSSGNTVVIKPSELAPNTSSVLSKLIKETFPENIVSVIEGDAEVSKNLLSKKWNYIFFTGSTRVGKIVASEAAKNLTPITLELGGKSPCIIDKDVNIDYEGYLNNLVEIFSECNRVLRPNGKLVINTPVMPIPKTVIKQDYPNSTEAKNIDAFISKAVASNQ